MSGTTAKQREYCRRGGEKARTRRWGGGLWNVASGHDLPITLPHSQWGHRLKSKTQNPNVDGEDDFQVPLYPEELLAVDRCWEGGSFSVKKEGQESCLLERANKESWQRANRNSNSTPGSQASEGGSGRLPHCRPTILTVTTHLLLLHWKWLQTDGRNTTRIYLLFID